MTLKLEKIEIVSQIFPRVAEDQVIDETWTHVIGKTALSSIANFYHNSCPAKPPQFSVGIDKKEDRQIYILSSALRAEDPLGFRVGGFLRRPSMGK